MPNRGFIDLPVHVKGSRDGSDITGRLRASSLSVIKDFKFRYEITDRDWDQETIGSATISYTSASSSAHLKTTTADGDRAILQSHQYWSTHPSKPYSFRAGIKFDTGQTNLNQRWGVFDNNNGVFFQYNGTSFQTVSRKNGTDTVVDQEDWNIDTLDGSTNARNPSGKKLDLDNVQFLVIEHAGTSITCMR